ncbi:MAG: NAD(+)/NADH kinase [Planctomycetota bacterium]|nr:MAG: NAD(+)/NADH kinase [Planctomycetota bacterium]
MHCFAVVRRVQTGAQRGTGRIARASLLRVAGRDVRGACGRIRPFSRRRCVYTALGNHRAEPVSMKRVAVIGSPEKDSVPETLERIRAWLRPRAEVVSAEITSDVGQALAAEPELLFVLGGDGTLIGAIHGLGRRQLPIVGVNLGKLGFLAEFSVEQLERDGDFLFERTVPVTRRVLLRVSIRHGDDEPFVTPAVNDCVLLAGPPYRLIEMVVEADGDTIARIRGDGLIVATPSGSTAHNLSAGGPILDPTASSFILTPICPHALTFRPLVMDSSRSITVRAPRPNDHTTLAIDGRILRPFGQGDSVTISRWEADLQLVRNPARSLWYALRRKLMWGRNPKNSH